MLSPTCNAVRSMNEAHIAVWPYGASLANRICPGGTSENRVDRSAGIHQAVSNRRFGWSGGGAPNPGQVTDPRMGEDQPRVREVAGELDSVQPERRDPAAGVDQDRQRALVGERDDLADDRVIKREVLGARVELDPARPRVERSPGLGDGAVVVRVDPAERNEQPVGSRPPPR